MKIKAQDIKTGNMLRTAIGTIVTVTQVHIFEKKQSPFVMPGRASAYLPPCVFIVYVDSKRVEGCYTFEIDEEVDRKFTIE